MKPRHRFYILVVVVAEGCDMLGLHEYRGLILAALAGKAVEKPIARKRKSMYDQRERDL